MIRGDQLRSPMAVEQADEVALDSAVQGLAAAPTRGAGYADAAPAGVAGQLADDGSPEQAVAGAVAAEAMGERGAVDLAEAE